MTTNQLSEASDEARMTITPSTPGELIAQWREAYAKTHPSTGNAPMIIYVRHGWFRFAGERKRYRRKEIEAMRDRLLTRLLQGTIA